MNEILSGHGEVQTLVLVHLPLCLERTDFSQLHSLGMNGNIV
jgi:hypothetical protein